MDSINKETESNSKENMFLPENMSIGDVKSNCSENGVDIPRTEFISNSTLANLIKRNPSSDCGLYVPNNSNLNNQANSNDSNISNLENQAGSNVPKSSVLENQANSNGFLKNDEIDQDSENQLTKSNVEFLENHKSLENQNCLRNNLDNYQIDSNIQSGVSIESSESIVENNNKLEEHQTSEKLQFSEIKSCDPCSSKENEVSVNTSLNVCPNDRSESEEIFSGTVIEDGKELPCRSIDAVFTSCNNQDKLRFEKEQEVSSESKSEINKPKEDIVRHEEVSKENNTYSDQIIPNDSLKCQKESLVSDVICAVKKAVAAEIMHNMIDSIYNSKLSEDGSPKFYHDGADNEKSDGSDSGIGSELIDEIITKTESQSSATSASSIEEEQNMDAAGLEPSWNTTCEGFTEEIDMISPKLPMPTFDDLTRSPCDVFETENQKLQKEAQSASKENRGGEAQTKEDIQEEEDIDISSTEDELLAPKLQPDVCPSPSLIDVISNIPSTSKQQVIFKSNLKRTCISQDKGYENEVPPSKKDRRGITFDNVHVYYFPRIQGFTCVPSQGGSTLGMSYSHSHVQSFTLPQYAQEQRRVHQRMAKSAQAMSETGSVSNDSNDDSDSDDPFSDQEFDSDSSYTLQPVKIRQRRAMLRAAGVDRIDPTEKNECKQIRISREFCGCSCEGYCDPEICTCALAGIKCQVDRQNYPCGCSRDCCANPKGRIEFNPVRVHTHFIQTMMRIKAEKKDGDEVSRMYDFHQYHHHHNYHHHPEYDSSAAFSNYYAHSQYLTNPHHHVHTHHTHNDLLSNFELQQQIHSCYDTYNHDMHLYNNISNHDKQITDSFNELIPSTYSPTDVSTSLYNTDATLGYRSYTATNSATTSVSRDYNQDERSATATVTQESMNGASFPSEQSQNSVVTNQGLKENNFSTCQSHYLATSSSGNALLMEHHMSSTSPHTKHETSEDHVHKEQQELSSQSNFFNRDQPEQDQIFAVSESNGFNNLGSQINGKLHSEVPSTYHEVPMPCTSHVSQFNNVHTGYSNSVELPPNYCKAATSSSLYTSHSSLEGTSAPTYTNSASIDPPAFNVTSDVTSSSLFCGNGVHETASNFNSTTTSLPAFSNSDSPNSLSCQINGESENFGEIIKKSMVETASA